MRVRKIKVLGLFGIAALLLISILLLLTFPANSVSAFAMESEQIAVESSCTELSEIGDFYTDKVIIVLNQDATRQFRTYAPKDFPEIDCV